MAYSVDVQTVIDRALRRANLQGDDVLDFISLEEQLDEFNASYAEWYDIIRLTTWGGQYYRTPSDPVTMIAGQSLYPFPDDFLALISIDCYVTVGGADSMQVIAAEPYQEEERNAFKWYPSMFGARGPVYYQIQGTSVNFIPYPVGAVQVVFNYVPVATKFTDTSQTFDSINEWDMWMVYDLAVKFLEKDGQTDMLPGLTGQRERQKARMNAAAPGRDTTRGEKVHDVLTINQNSPWWLP